MRKTGNNYSGPQWTFSQRPARDRQAIRDILTMRYHGTIEVTEEMIDAVADALDAKNGR